jgi:AraC family ethanolamine operon transcriptional activator
VRVEAVKIRQTGFSDFEALRDAVQDGASEIVQLERGPIVGKLAHYSVGSVGISTGNFTRGVRQRGVLSEQRWTLGIIAAPAKMLHFEMAPGDLLILAPGHELYSSFSGANNYAATLVDPEELFALLAIQPGAQETAWRQSATVMTGATVTPAQFSMLLTALREHGATMSAEVADFYKRIILELLTAPVRDSANYRGPHLKSAAALVREVDRFLIEAGARPVHISELCAEFGVPRRSLHRAFMEVLGVSPLQFFRRKRLGDAHTALLMAAPGVTITGIAIEHGFADVGRFAKGYRLLFGELPSETLRRRNINGARRP